ncbi:cache domain-containing protein [Geomonas subterranea]|uniref:Cache domain-containing protein n=1 Tax=Geomonas subterranea TaxID=2847989 RepID=A0ABX8LJL9_9BACT|nr:methyl-accepting chemotaxis protein [Geomonas subterranea]QXE90987.1 cache domain-containing protein [Geomonas subterranea]QXM10927.1 cache domain-containing protein [Geomonas subterranea]
MKRFRDWGIFHKIISATLLSWLLLVGISVFLLTPYLRTLIMNEREETVRAIVQQATSRMKWYQDQVDRGLVTREEAQRRTMQELSAARYQGTNYIWINDLTPRMVMHPLKPELNGKDLGQFKDPAGKLLFMEMVRACNEKGQGFVSYRWPKGANGAPEPKLSYVELFRPWGWVVGTGIYLDDVRATLLRTQLYIGAGLIVVLALTLLLTWFIARSITHPLRDMVKAVEAIATGDGDLSRSITCGRSDELGALAGNMNIFIETLHALVASVLKVSIDVVIGSSRVHGMAKQINCNADDLAAQSVSVATASEEMSATSQDIARSCAQAAQGGTTTSRVASDGAQVVNETVAGMHQIAKLVRESATTVAGLGRRSDQIGEIIGTIEEIADQTNLLALNAAIEAARAGEQGRGFAVVADEVRALAERTTRATKEIGAMIGAIQAETRAAVRSMEHGVSVVEKGSEGAQLSGQALQDIISRIEGVTGDLAQIATAAEEQSATTHEIAASVQRVTEIARDTSSETQRTTHEANHLLSMAEELMALLGKFKIKEDTGLIISKARSAHMIFVGKIKGHLDGTLKLDPQALPTHLTCAFGKWYQSKGREDCGHSDLYRQIDAPHAKVHELGKQAVLACNSGDRARAAELCAEMVAASQVLLGILEQLAGGGTGRG